MKHARIYILIADGSRARLLLSEGIGTPLAEVQGAQYHVELKPDHELHGDRPGRVQESANAARHAD
ncbi:MAG: host attachment protein [Rhodomicrobium sp.]